MTEEIEAIAKRLVVGRKRDGRSIYDPQARGDLVRVCRQSDVSLAKIAPHRDQVVDVFYVTDREGSKLQDDRRLAEIRAELAARIEDFEHCGLVAHAAG